MTTDSQYTFLDVVDLLRGDDERLTRAWELWTQMRIATALERIAPPEGVDLGTVIGGAIADGMRDGALHASEIAWTFMNNQRGG